jgi:hypothetical protein
MILWHGSQNMSRAWWFKEMTTINAEKSRIVLHKDGGITLHVPGGYARHYDRESMFICAVELCDLCENGYASNLIKNSDKKWFFEPTDDEIKSGTYMVFTIEEFRLMNWEEVFSIGRKSFSYLYLEMVKWIVLQEESEWV